MLSWFRGNKGVSVLMFHNLCERIPEYALLPGGRTFFFEAEDFSRLIAWCSKNYDILRLSELEQYLIKSTRKSQAVVLTFDDGLASAIDLALPILREYQAPAVIFVTTEWTTSGRTPDIFALERLVWENIPASLVIRVKGRAFEVEINSRERACKTFTDLWSFLVEIRFSPLELMAENVFINGKPWKRQDTLDDRHFWFPANWEELRAASKSGLVEIGSHMISHTPLTWLSGNEKLFQLQRSRDILSDIIGCPATACAYPHGLIDEETIAMAENIYRWNFTDKPGRVHRKTRPGAVPRYHVPGEAPEKVRRILYKG